MTGALDGTEGIESISYKPNGIINASFYLSAECEIHTDLDSLSSFIHDNVKGYFLVI